MKKTLIGIALSSLFALAASCTTDVSSTAAPNSGKSRVLVAVKQGITRIASDDKNIVWFDALGNVFTCAKPACDSFRSRMATTRPTLNGINTPTSQNMPTTPVPSINLLQLYCLISSSEVCSRTHWSGGAVSLAAHPMQRKMVQAATTIRVGLPFGWRAQE